MKKKVCVLVLENLRSVENTASIFRSAESFGVAEIILVGTTPAPIDRFGRKRPDFAKVSLGTEGTVSWKHKGDIGSALEGLKQKGFQIVALEQGPDARRLKDFKPAPKFALVVGNEVAGVSKGALAGANAVVEIPMRGKKESLNVAVATGVALFVLLW